MSKLRDAVASALDVAKQIRSDIDALDDPNASVKALAAELVAALSEVRIEAAESVGEITTLRNQLAFVSTMTYEEPFYWKSVETDRDGPFCSRCFDVDGKAVRVPLDFKKERICPECKRSFGTFKSSGFGNGKVSVG